MNKSYSDHHQINATAESRTAAEATNAFADFTHENPSAG
jgi:hypothetical protein